MTHPANHECPNCQAKVHRPCTQPTDTGRTPVAWFHESRVALALSAGPHEQGIVHHLDHDGFCTTCHEPAEYLKARLRPNDRVEYPPASREVHPTIEGATDA